MSNPAIGSRTCPSCLRPTPGGLFDVTVASGLGDERHFFALPASACRACDRLILDADVLRLFRIDPADVRFGIASDRWLEADEGAEAA